MILTRISRRFWRLNSAGVIRPATGVTQILVPEGTDALPGIAVVGRTGTGIRIRTADELRYSANGVNMGQLDAAGSRQNRCRTISAGTVADPAFSCISFLDGIYFPADEQVAIAAGGEQQGMFDATALAADETAFTLRNNDGGGGEALDRVTLNTKHLVFA